MTHTKQPPANPERFKRERRLIQAIQSALIAAGLEVTGVTLEEVEGGNDDSHGKAAGVKHVSAVRVTLGDGSNRRYFVKSIREDGVRVKECEGIISLYRLSRFDRDALGVWIFDDHTKQHPIVGSGEPREVLLLEPCREDPLLADVLLAAPGSPEAKAIGRTLALHLKQRHEPVHTTLDHYARELIGGSFGLLATLDAYPAGELSHEEYTTAAQFAVKWVKRLVRGRAVRIHGDFHPWNVFINESQKLVTATGGLHTSYGLAEDDIACMALNLRLMDSGGEALRAFLETLQTKSDLFGFFLGWRLLVLANPLHYPTRGDMERRSLFRAAMFALAGEDLASDLDTLLRQLLQDGNPWAAVHLPFKDRTAEAVYAGVEVGQSNRISKGQLVQLEGNRLEVAGRVLAIRQMKRTIFIDIESNGAIQVVIPRALSPAVSALRVGDLVDVSGRSGVTWSGEPSLLADQIRWWHPCLLVPESADSELRRTPMYVALSELLRSARTVLEKRGFAELATDTLRPTYEGGRARPFWTWSHAHGRRLYLRVTSELSLKGALARGIDRVYEIGPMYRNETEDGRHLPEFLMLEAYSAFSGLDEGIDLVCSILHEADKHRRLCSQRRFRFDKAFTEYLDVNVSDDISVSRYCAANDVPWPSSEDGRLGTLHRLLRRHVAPKSTGILVVEGLPEGRSPLSRVEHGQYARAWVFADGVSVADVAFEETSPSIIADLLNRQFESDRYPVARDYRPFMRTMLLGLPPCVGVGMSVSRVLQVLQGLGSIRSTKLPT